MTTLCKPAFAAATLLFAALAACNRQPEEKPVEKTGPTEAATRSPAATVTPEPADSVPGTSLLESRNCATVLRFYGDALHSRRYADAARVWGKDGGVDAAILQKRFADPGAVTLDIGEVAEEGAAGSLYCTAQVVLREKGLAQPGTLILRRVNDVAGATAAQLRWHITESSFAERG